MKNYAKTLLASILASTIIGGSAINIPAKGSVSPSSTQTIIRSVSEPEKEYIDLDKTSIDMVQNLQPENYKEFLKDVEKEKQLRIKEEEERKRKEEEERIRKEKEEAAKREKEQTVQRYGMVKFDRGGDLNTAFKKSGPFNKDLQSLSGASIDDVRAMLSPGLKGIEYAVLDVERIYGVNALFTIAVAKLESSHGKSDLAVQKNNIFSMNANDNAVHRAYGYVNKSQSVYDFGKVIRKYYLDENRTTLRKINNKYCSAASWTDKIDGLMNENIAMANKYRNGK